MTETTPSDREKQDLLAILDRQRWFLTTTAKDLTDEQARATPTASELQIGGIIKHVTATERGWIAFMTGQDMAEAAGDWWAGHHLLETETLAGVLADYAAVREEMAAAVAAADLDESHELPPAPWFEPGARWSNRHVVLHMISETAQHSGHADIIRETIDGQKTMG